MERVETLLQKLQQQFSEKAAPSELLRTVRLLELELSSLPESIVPVDIPVAISLPPRPPQPVMEVTDQPDSVTPVAAEEKIIEILRVDEAEVEAELEEIKRNAAVMQRMSYQSKPQLLFDPIENDIPTLRQPMVANKEIHHLEEEMPTFSLNEVLKEEKTEVSEKLNELPIKDLKKAIGVNDRFLYINELFRGDEAMYERSIKTINSFSIWPEAEYWIRRELKTKLGWNDKDEIVQQFDKLVQKRFG